MLSNFLEAEQSDVCKLLACGMEARNRLGLANRSAGQSAGPFALSHRLEHAQDAISCLACYNMHRAQNQIVSSCSGLLPSPSVHRRSITAPTVVLGIRRPSAQKSPCFPAPPAIPSHSPRHH